MSIARNRHLGLTLKSQCKRVLAALSAGLLWMQFACPRGEAAPLNYNLTSTNHTLVVAPTTHPLPSINVGGKAQPVTVSESLTPAEMVALNQVVATGMQTIVIGAAGNATGGRLNVGVDMGQTLASLTIPQKVSAVDIFGAGSVLSLTGDLTNAGSLVLSTTNSQTNTVTISAADINNMSGGLISTLGSAHPLNLALSTTSIVNAGTIDSSGDINILSPTAATINVNNTGGTLQAAGNLNVRDSSFTGNYDFNLIGGNVYSQAVNIFSDRAGIVSWKLCEMPNMLR